MSISLLVFLENEAHLRIGINSFDAKAELNSIVLGRFCFAALYNVWIACSFVISHVMPYKLLWDLTDSLDQMFSY